MRSWYSLVVLFVILQGAKAKKCSKILRRVPVQRNFDIDKVKFVFVVTYPDYNVLNVSYVLL